MKIKCANCSKLVEIKNFSDVKTYKCPKCKHVITADQAKPQPAPDATAGLAERLRVLQEMLFGFGYEISADRRRYRKVYGESSGGTVTVDIMINTQIPTFNEPGQAPPLLITGFSVTRHDLIPAAVSQDTLKELLPEICHQDILPILSQSDTGVKHDVPSVVAVKCEDCPPGQPPIDQWLIVGGKLLCLKCAKSSKA